MAINSSTTLSSFDVGRPIIYSQVMTIRFDDLDPYGHVNASRYIDFVGSSRLIYASKALNLNPDYLLSRGCGWFLKNIDCTFKKPINGLQDVMVKSWVANFTGDSRFLVVFEMSSEDGRRIFSQGSLTYVTMDLKANAPANLPEWLFPYFFARSEA